MSQEIPISMFLVLARGRKRLGCSDLGSLRLVVSKKPKLCIVLFLKLADSLSDLSL